MAGPRGPWRRNRARENDSRGPQLSSYRKGNTVSVDPTACSPRERLLGDGDLDPVQLGLVVCGQPAACQVPRRGPAAPAARRNALTAATMAGRGRVICRSTVALAEPGTGDGITCGQY